MAEGKDSRNGPGSWALLRMEGMQSLSGNCGLQELVICFASLGISQPWLAAQRRGSSSSPVRSRELALDCRGDRCGDVVKKLEEEAGPVAQGPEDEEKLGI